MSSTRSNSPPTTSPDFIPPLESPHLEKESGMDGEEDNTSQTSCLSPPRSPTPPILIKKEKHPPEEPGDMEFSPAENFNPTEIEAPKEDSKAQKVKDEKSAVAEPVVISTSITTTNVKDLHEYCQSHVRLTPSFEFKAQPPSGFSAILKLVGPEGAKEIPAEGVYPSKKHAKEAAAGLGLEYVRTLPKSSRSMMQDDPEEQKENWVGSLSDWCNARRTRPSYTDYATPGGAGFSCEIRLPVELGYAGLEGMVFGDKHKAFKNKRSAKVAAAKEAMLWIRENSPTSSPAGSTTTSSKKSKLGKGTGNVIYPEGSKPAAIVNLVCPRLGVMTPEYVFVADQRTPGMYDVKAIIRRPSGPKDVMVGPLKNVYGKKKAKEEISNGVYNWIKKEAERQGVGIFEAGTEP